ncbi:hypothetical protein SAMN05660209_04602 [Geodermatophilus africanus]|uniref:Uncharacterized protein n=1 Tax=Geodermatophilus africanus TaxID=1137993 RepID=A0A1H3Q3I9_9ACTN|nr:hypothetical protein SAMN05660209_04602 [Geodermatophilus africanus]
MVFRGNRATCVAGSAPTNRVVVSCACSYRAVEYCDFAPAPRCTLEYHGRKSSTARRTASDAAVVAAVSRST